MIIYEQKIVWALHNLILTNQKAIYWPDEKALILSDLHLGKAAHFRKNGIPIPSQIHQRDLDILEKLLNHYDVNKVIIVGDLIHANQNNEVLEFKNFIGKYPSVEFTLVKGNHDRISDRKIADLGFCTITNELVLNGIKFVHEPSLTDDYQISGHIHPGVSLRLPTNKHVRLPSYVVSKQMIILPAFSQFTGLDTKQIVANAVNYAILDTGIMVIK